MIVLLHLTVSRISHFSDLLFSSFLTPWIYHQLLQLHDTVYTG